jgi:hypothetical protein
MPTESLFTKMANFWSSDLPLWCRLGWHQWYHGEFIAPVYGRYERHCLGCPKRQYADYEGNGRIWVDFEYDPENAI